MSEEQPDYAMGFLLSVIAAVCTILGVAFIPCVKMKIASEKTITAVALAFAAGVMIWVALMEALSHGSLESFEQHYAALANTTGVVDPHAGHDHGLYQRALSRGALGYFSKHYQALANAETAGDDGHGHDHDHDHDDGEEEENLELYARLWMAFFFFLGALVTIVLDKLVSSCFGHSHSHGSDEHSHESEEPDVVTKQKLRDVTSRSFGALSGAPLANAEVGSGAGEEAKADQESAHKGSLEVDDSTVRKNDLMRVSLVAFMGLTLHNFPEGLAAFFGGAAGSWVIAFAIAVHNVPEGAAIAIPVYQGTGSWVKATAAAALAGLAQPVGAAVGWILVAAIGLKQVPDFFYGAIFAISSGVMVAVSFFGLLAEAYRSTAGTVVAFSVFAGFVIMEASILILDATGGHSH